MRPIQMSRMAGFVILTLSMLFLGSCESSGQKYALTGRVITKQPATSQLVIDNDDIPGFMSPMTMPYTVKDADGFSRVQPADIVRADVIVQPGGKVWLEHLVVTGKTAPKNPGDGSPARVVLIGEKAPDFPMVNQDGKPIRFSQFAGKVVLFTFIYTRCPFPDFCPLLSNKFSEIQRDVSRIPDESKKMHLVSISLDPTFDKPPVLRKYGLPYIQNDPAGFAQWDFVSTTPADLQTLVTSFGLSFSQQGDQISHSMNTILLAADGTVADMWPGNDWQTSEVLDVMRHAVASIR